MPVPFTATATDADIPAQGLTFSLTGTVPTGASVGATSGLFTWNPAENQGPRLPGCPVGLLTTPPGEGIGSHVYAGLDSPQ